MQYHLYRLLSCILAIVLGGLAAISVLGLATSDKLHEIAWYQSNMPYAVTRSQAAILSSSSRNILFVIGGDQSATITDKVIFSILQKDGTPGEWTNTLHLPSPLSFHTAVSIDGRIYVIGGGLSIATLFDVIYCAQPDSLGGISTWPTQTLGRKLAGHTAVASGSRIYVMGGFEGSTWSNTDIVKSADVGTDCYHPLIWRTEEDLLFDVSAHTSAIAELQNGRKFIYVIGGYTERTNALTYTLQRSEIQVNQSGILSKWQNLGVVSTTRGMQLMTSVVSGDYLYVIGGLPDVMAGTSVATVYRAKIRTNGDLDPWAQLNDIPIPLDGLASFVSSLGQIYLVGGRSFTSPQNSVYFTPLTLLSKSADPPTETFAYDLITYTIHFASNNLRAFTNLIISDAIPTNTWLVRDRYLSDTKIITFPITTLDVDGSGTFSFQVQVKPRPTPTPTNTPVVAIAVTKAPAEKPSPCDDPEDSVVHSPTTCTPTPTITMTPTITQTPTLTSTPTPTPTSTSTPTLDTTPIPVFNQATLCEGNVLWCIQSNIVVNTPYRFYLPIIFKQASTN